jgi:hypothetical protein
VARGTTTDAVRFKDDTFEDGPISPFGSATATGIGPLSVYVTLTNTGSASTTPTTAQVTATGRNATVTTSTAPSQQVTAYNTLGVFRGSNAPGAIAQFESSVGINRQMPGPIVDFTGGSGSGGTAWSSRLSQVTATMNAWRTLVVTQDYELLLSYRPWPTSLGQQLATMASGAYDDFYTAEAVVMRDRGYNANNLILRPMWEFNGAFYPHSIGGGANGANAVPNFIAGWRRMVNRFREIIPGLQFDWCPLRLTGTPEFVESAYPGDDYVDYIGMDAYNWRSSTDDLALRWTRLVQGGSTAGATVGLQWHKDFALEHQKPMTFAEWGVTRRRIGNDPITNSESPVSDGGDNDPYYIEHFHDWLDELGAIELDDGRSLLHSSAYFEVDALDAWHQLHSYSGDAQLYSFFDDTTTAFDTLFRG